MLLRWQKIGARLRDVSATSSSSSSPSTPPPLPLPILFVSGGGDVFPQAACTGRPATPGGRPLDPGEETRCGEEGSCRDEGPRGEGARGYEGGRGDGGRGDEDPHGESGRGYSGRGGDGGRGDPSCPNPQGGGDRRGAGAGIPPALPAELRAQGGGRRRFPLHPATAAGGCRERPFQRISGNRCNKIYKFC
ncbi:hypothetical protein PVAP13_4NG158343 [Panicum virgatum]|uniref:Uncharacterized protein n=1 Tax=Panicum virgatum TaxID=38727 RepID=A0A8T0T992_PANVG|nr:hypothetical protein PVAP13_4NG158343 [Panicum virgatum]